MLDSSVMLRLLEHFCKSTILAESFRITVVIENKREQLFVYLFVYSDLCARTLFALTFAIYLLERAVGQAT